jgi:hypothetical protein
MLRRAELAPLLSDPASEEAAEQARLYEEQARRFPSADAM